MQESGADRIIRCIFDLADGGAKEDYATFEKSAGQGRRDRDASLAKDGKGDEENEKYQTGQRPIDDERIAGIGAVIFGIFWTIMAVQMGAPIFLPRLALFSL